MSPEIGRLVAAGWSILFDPSPDGGEPKVSIEITDGRRAYKLTAPQDALFDEFHLRLVFARLMQQAGVK